LLLPLTALGSFLPGSQGSRPGVQQNLMNLLLNLWPFTPSFLIRPNQDRLSVRQAASLEVSKDRPFIDHFPRVHSRAPVSRDSSAEGLAAPSTRSVLEVSHLFDGLLLASDTSLLHLAPDHGVHRVAPAAKQDSRRVPSTLRSVPSARSIAPTSCPAVTSG